jgi:transaldolase
MTNPRPQALSGLRVKIFADGADREGIARLAANPAVRGFTTNPTLMRAAGVTDYEAFARDVLEIVPDRPISFEVMSDDFDEMERQALKIAAWGDNVFVKIPITNCSGEPSLPLIRRLAAQGVQQNVTALMTLPHVEAAAAALLDGPPGFVSLFAGRIADTGRDPLPMVRQAVEILGDPPRDELVWASPRELLNLFQADEAGCHVITMTHDLLKKLGSVGKDLDQFSLETVRMFFNDAQAAGYTF